MNHPSLLSFSRANLVALAVVSAGVALAAEPLFTGPIAAGELAAPPKNEASGIAASRRNPELMWVHDDSGGKPLLYAVGPTGALRGTLQIGGGVKNEDWEDIAATELDGKSWLVIGDVGDNDAKRRHVELHFIEEPAADRLADVSPLAERPAATLRLTYEDGQRDCEAIAVDAGERAVYLLTKRDTPPRLYRVVIPSPLRHADVTARFVGILPHLPQPTAAQAAIKGHLGKRRAQPCAMDFAPDGSAAVVLTYGDVLVFPRRSGEPWAEALGRPPMRLPGHELPQAEAAGFSSDGRRIYVASEGTRKWVRYDRR